MKKLLHLKRETFAIPVPENADDFIIDPEYEYPDGTKTKQPVFFYGNKKIDAPLGYYVLPPGNWQILGRANSLTINDLNMRLGIPLLNTHSFWENYCFTFNIHNDIILTRV